MELLTGLFVQGLEPVMEGAKKTTTKSCFKHIYSRREGLRGGISELTLNLTEVHYSISDS